MILFQSFRIKLPLTSQSTMASTTTDSVYNIISAFTDSLDRLRNLREKRRKKKGTKLHRTKAQGGEHNGSELRLSRSLRESPVDIQKEYERHYRSNGDRYAIGDCESF